MTLATCADMICRRASLADDRRHTSDDAECEGDGSVGARRRRAPNFLASFGVVASPRYLSTMVSLLDIIGPVMVGPSISHTAGACRLGLLARGLVGGTPERSLIELHGSFA